MSEIWKSIFGGLYSVSNLGRVRRDVARSSTKAGAILKPASKRGYLYVNLHDCGVKKIESVHALVAQAFLGPRPTGWEVNHINADRGDNREENLEYTTHQANILHASLLGRLHGSGVRGERQGSAKLTEAAVREIRRERARGTTLKALAKKHGVTFGCIRHAAVGFTWAHIPMEDVA